MMSEILTLHCCFGNCDFIQPKIEGILEIDKRLAVFLSFPVCRMHYMYMPTKILTPSDLVTLISYFL